jgi:hypothetical protein
MAPNPITTQPTAPSWRPSFKDSTDKDVANAINRLFDLVAQLQNQVQTLAAYLKVNP